MRGLLYEVYDWPVDVMDVVASSASRRHEIEGALGSSELRGEDRSTGGFWEDEDPEEDDEDDVRRDEDELEPCWAEPGMS